MNAHVPPAAVDFAKQLFARRGHASVSYLQCHLKLGYQAALELLDALKAQAGTEQRGEHRPDLPIETALFPENRRGGLLLCGINDGLTKAEAQMDAAGIDRSATFRSFFSDERVQQTRFRGAITKWFAHWGYHLQNDWRIAQGLDRALVHTNWLMSATNNVSGVNVRQACIAEPDPFLKLCEELRPGLILFFSKNLLSAFTSGELKSRVETLFGPARAGTEWFKETVPGAVSFIVGIQRYRDVTAISVPHPSARGLRDDYVSALAPRLSTEIEAWWTPHWARLSGESSAQPTA